jgi:alkylation response protein AidB-like acyl-CoA dehydrogenase
VRPLATSTATGLCALRLDLVAAAGDRLALAPADRDGALARARLRQASYLVGLCLGALQATVRYARERRQFDRPLVEHQAVGFRLAGLAAGLLGTRLLAHHAAWLDDAGRPAGVAATEALAAAGELALALTRSCMQAHGAFGSTRAAPIQRFYRHALVEAQRLGRPGDLWREAGGLRLAAAQGGA